MGRSPGPGAQSGAVAGSRSGPLGAIARSLARGARTLGAWILIVVGVPLGLCLSPFLVLGAWLRSRRRPAREGPRGPRQTVREIRGGRVIERGLTPIERLGKVDEALAAYGIIPWAPWDRSKRRKRRP